jgi:predicted PurR-regulated permease PerM
MVFVPRDSLTTRGELETFAYKLVIVALFVACLALLWQVRHVLILVFVAAVLAAGIAPAVHRVRVVGRHWLHRNVPRGTAVLLVYVPFLILVVVLAIVLVPRLIVDTRALSAQLPELLERNVFAPLEHYVPMAAARQYIHGGIHVPRTSLFIYARTAGSAIASFVAVLFMVVYMLIDAHRLRNMILLLYPADVRGKRARTLKRIGRRMSSWLAAQLIICATMGVAMFAALLLLRVPYALPLALLAAVGELVPVIGPILSSIPALAIAILQSPWQFWSLLAMALVFQKLENFLLVPRVMARKVKISPLAVFIAFLAGGTLLGITGAIMAVPVAAIVQVVFDEVFVERRERRLDFTRAGTLARRR